MCSDNLAVTEWQQASNTIMMLHKRFPLPENFYEHPKARPLEIITRSDCTLPFSRAARTVIYSGAPAASQQLLLEAAQSALTLRE